MKLSKNNNMNTVMAYSRCAGSTCWCNVNCTSSSNNLSIGAQIANVVINNG